MSAGLEAALTYVKEYDWFVAPLWWVKEDGSCACRKGTACGRSAGKHPITANGINDSTQDEVIIRRWYEQYPEAGVAADIRKSGLVLLGPDSVEWQERFEEKGLNIGGATIDTGGGPGHLHYIHRRPADMPIGRINRSGEYDLMTEGVLPLPPSKHYSGKFRTWVVPPDKWMAEAPEVTVKMLLISKEQQLVPVDLPDNLYAEPPVRLSGPGQRWWDGIGYSTKPDGSLDRSQTILVMGRYLAEAGASVLTIAATLDEWAVRWGYTKYQERSDGAKQILDLAIQVYFEVSAKEEEVEGIESMQVYTLTDLLTTTFEKPPMFVDPLIPATGITLLAGASGSLKTAVVADLFLAMFEKRLWLGHYTVPDCRRILYLDGEIGIQALQVRLMSMGAQPSDNLHYIYKTWRLENDKEYEKLMEFVEQGQYELILVDSISAMHSLEERTDTTVLVMKRLRGLADAINGPLVVLANFNKTTSEKRELLERISGPSVYRNKSTAIITLRRFGGKKMLKARMQLQKNWFGQEGEARTLELAKDDAGIFRFTSEEWDPNPQDDEDDAEEQKQANPAELAQTQFFVAIQGYESDQPIGWIELIDSIHGVKGVSRELALQTVQAMVIEGVITEPERLGRGGKQFTFRKIVEDQKF
jgi:hypothetical protein